MRAIIVKKDIQSFVCDPPVTTNNEETFPQDFLEILKPSLQNF